MYFEVHKTSNNGKLVPPQAWRRCGSCLNVGVGVFIYRDMHT